MSGSAAVGKAWPATARPRAIEARMLVLSGRMAASDASRASTRVGDNGAASERVPRASALARKTATIDLSDPARSPLRQPRPSRATEKRRRVAVTKSRRDRATLHDLSSGYYVPRTWPISLDLAINVTDMQRSVMKKARQYIGRRNRDGETAAPKSTKSRVAPCAPLFWERIRRPNV